MAIFLIPQRVSIELLGDFPTPWKILRRFVQITVLHYRISKFFYIQRIRDALALGFPLKQSSNNIKNTFTNKPKSLKGFNADREN